MGSRLGEQGAGTAGGAVAGSGEGVVLACGKGRQAKAGKEATDRVIHHEAPTLYLWSLMYHGPTVVIVFYISVGQLQVYVTSRSRPYTGILGTRCRPAVTLPPHVLQA